MLPLGSMNYAQGHIEFSRHAAQPLWEDDLRSEIWPRKRIIWVVAIYLALFIIRPWELLFPELADIRFERLMVLFVLGMTALSCGISIRMTMQSVAMLLLLTAVWVSSLFAYVPEMAAKELTEFIGITISFFVLLKVIRTPYQLFFLVACYFVATSLYVFKSEWEYFIHDAAKWEMGVRRLRGIDLTSDHPNAVGSTILCSLPFALFFHRVREEFCARWPKRFQTLFTWFLYVYVGSALCGVLLTRSRAAALGLVVFALLLVLRQRGFAQRLKWGVLAVIAFAVLFAASPRDIQLRIRSTWDKSIERRANFKGANSSAEGRWEGWVAGLEIFRRFPISGVGIGSFKTYRVEQVDGVALNAHNLPGELLGETGILGAGAFAFFYFVLITNSRKLIALGRQVAEISGSRIYMLFGIACFDAIMLLTYGGISGHNLQRYLWYWYAAFVVLALAYARGEYDRLLAAGQDRIPVGTAQATNV